MTSSNGYFFRVTGSLCGNSPVNSPHKVQWNGNRMFFYLRLNKQLSKQMRRPWFETRSRSLWRHCNEECQWDMRRGLHIACIALLWLVGLNIGWDCPSGNTLWDHVTSPYSAQTAGKIPAVRTVKENWERAWKRLSERTSECISEFVWKKWQYMSVDGQMGVLSTLHW